MNAVHVFPSVPASRYVDTRFDTGGSNVLWLTLPDSVDGRPPCFTVPLIDDLRGLFHSLKQHDACWPSMGFLQPVHYTVMKSSHPDYFSLGGDLAHFHDCIRRRDRESLHRYSRVCADMLFEWSGELGTQTTSIALIQGRALGGGFETALAADFIVAEEHSEFGFPEILFGLFPCTGGMSLLAQRIGARAAERMLGDGRIYSAKTLLDMGVIDEICPRGEGERAVERLIAEHVKHRPARLMLQRSRHRIAPLDLTELHQVVDEWVETAMCLGPQDLRVMETLVKLQRGRAVS
ncbi:MAG: crotonase/enoyl-CoA hydratase family protein [Dokdonella sp.]|uniref:crotonase/enoyl-CoA hydratase family protein n=1 Tax=Dokdonella sp. TaxID=2291710 RepID=UPI002C60729D|nr:crotonase/enoyl-CoA hydratase family protein [Dokdonella sp.]HOX72587.1 crotonase/enoyl-CoA hydratase family protein [Dokdonella sp.]